jgi:hypothetical protein
MVIKSKVVSAITAICQVCIILLGNNNKNRPSTANYMQNAGPNYCEYTEGNVTDTNCFKLLAQKVKRKPAWFFMGDSQMNMLVNGTKYPYEIVSTRLPGDENPPLRGRCDSLNYYYLERAPVWVPPATNEMGKKIQGPVLFGLRNHFCLDASGIYNRLYSSSSLNFMEYLAVEYASDVEHQSTITNTSQESAVVYMKRQLDNLFLTRDDSVCVVNAGIHDQKLCPDLVNEETCLGVYIHNVKTYIQLLRTVCGHVLWISISSVRGDKIHPQDNSRSLLWNQRVNETLQENYAHNSYFIDVWNASLYGVRNSNIHFEPEYYSQLAFLFSSLM